MASQYLIVDNGVLSTLWKVGGWQALNTLFETPYQVVIPQDGAR